MITCKEDLIGTEFKVTCKEEADLLKEKCELLGIEHATWGSCSYTGGVMRGLIGKDLGTPHSCKLLFTGRSECDDSMGEFRALRFVSIKDLKPKPTKFVKVEESIFDLKGEFERGELFTKKAWGEYVLIKEDTHLASLYEMQSHENSKIGIYRKVEIDWRDEVADFTGLGKDFYTWVDCIDDMYDFNFVEMCHLVASLTEKPTN